MEIDDDGERVMRGGGKEGGGESGRFRMETEKDGWGKKSK